MDGPERGVGVWLMEDPAEERGLRPMRFGPPMAHAVESDPVVRGADLGAAGATRASRRTMVDVGRRSAAADAPRVRVADRGTHRRGERAARHADNLPTPASNPGRT